MLPIIRAVAELMAGKQIDMPPVRDTFKQAQRVDVPLGEQGAPGG